MNRFLSIGECMIELSPTPAGDYAMNFAGDTFNTAWYARKLASKDLDVIFLSAIGDDTPSQQMADFMAASGVLPDLAVRPGGHVGLYMVTLTNGERSFSYWRDTSAAKSLADDLDHLPGLAPGDMVFFSGITMAILPEAGRVRLLKVLKAAREQGVSIAFDPNLRPRLWPSSQEMCHWITEAAQCADIALPSFDDEATYFGDANQRATAQRYRDAGARLVVTKDGGDPVLILDGNEEDTVQPPPVAHLIDSTAAGDSFNAGFLVVYGTGASPTAAARRGCDLAAQVVTKRGALVDIT